MLVSQKYHLSRARTLALLDTLGGADDSARALYVPPGLPAQQVVEMLAKVDTESVASELPELAAGSKTGAVILWGREQKYLIMPPFPVAESRAEHGYFVEPLRSVLGRDRVVALVLVRLGSYGIGLCQGEKFVASKVGTGNVHSRHRQGGSSAHRFERHRDKQIETFLTRVCGHALEVLGPSAREVEHIVYGGAQTTILLLRKQCPFLGRFDDRTLPPLLDIPDPRQHVLEASIGRAWSSMVVEWRDSAKPTGGDKLGM